MVIEIASMFIVLIAIFTLLRVRNWMYKKRGFTVGTYEDAILCISFFFGSLFIGLLIHEKIWILLALPFFVYLLTPVILFSMRQWGEFLGLLDRYIRR